MEKTDEDDGYIDSDGYPTGFALKKITEWDYKDRFNLMAFMKSIWWMPDCGWHETEHDDSIIYNISTGGWSGNESIIGALEHNFIFWLLCWEQARRGGHYIFEVKKEK